MRRYLAALALVCASAVPLHGQSALLESCAAQDIGSHPGVPGAVQDQFQFMCAQVVNSLSNVQPSVGIAFSGGNPVLGTGTTLGTRIGSIPRVSLTARANFALVELPGLFDGYTARISDSQSELPTMGTTSMPIGSLQGDVSVGVFNGISVSPMVGGIGSVDLLGSVALLPKFEDFGINDAIMNIGVGARVGLLKQGIVAPGISLSGMYRRMGDVGFGDLAKGDAGSFSSNLSTFSLRGVVSKGIGLLDAAVGAGYDRYSSDIDLGWVMTCESAACLAANQNQALELPGGVDGDLTTAAWNVFGDLTLDLMLLKLVGEVGYQKAMDVIDLDDLSDASLPEQSLTSDDLGGGRLFGSLGLRIAL